MEACSYVTLIGSSGETACYRIASHEIDHIRPRDKLINSFVNEKWNIKAKGCGQEANRIGSIAAQKGSSQGIIPALERFSVQGNPGE
ncbi:hypothetical protein LguiB_036023 [Lonicera macranthoides]